MDTKVRKSAQTLFVWLLVAVLLVFLLYPLFIMLMGSFKTSTEIASNPAGFPARLQFANYIGLLDYNGGIMVRAYLNSIFVSTAYTVLVVFIAAMAGFAFSKYEFRGKKLFFLLLLATMMVPSELNIPPLYIMFSQIGWLNSYEVQIFPGIASVFAMFMFRQYMESIPTSLIEAARMDGAGHFRVFRSIMMPVAMPVAGTLSILTFLGKWNDYLWPIIMVSEREFQPIMAILPTLNTKEDVWFIPWELVLTGCVVVTLPMIVVFCLFQEQFMSSVTIGAVKE